MTLLYAQHFTRKNYRLRPPLQEEVCVIVESDDYYQDDGVATIAGLLWATLFVQYPSWVSTRYECMTEREKWRHGFSTPVANGPVISLDETNPHYTDFREPPKEVQPGHIDVTLTAGADLPRVVNAIGMIRGVAKAETD